MFVHWNFILEVNNQRTTPTWQHFFCEFWYKEFV
jgi:hypothetical protein